MNKLLGYLNDAGRLNLSRFEVFMDEMSEVDRELFREKYEDLKYMESKYVRLIRLVGETQISLS